MNCKYELSSSNISDVLNSIQREAEKVGKSGTPLFGTGLALVIGLRLCLLMKIRERVRRAWLKAAGLPSTFDGQVGRDDDGFDQFMATTQAMSIRLNTVLGGIDRNIENLCGDAEKLSEALSSALTDDGRETVDMASYLLDAVVDAASEESGRRDPDEVMAEANEIIERIVASSWEIGGIIGVLRERAQSEFAQMEAGLARLEGGVERVSEACEQEKLARKTVMPGLNTIAPGWAANDGKFFVQPEAAASIETPVQPSGSTPVAPAAEEAKADVPLAQAAANLRNMMSKLKRDAAASAADETR